MGISALLASQILDASATGRSVITGADASAIRTTLGLGTLSTQSPTGTPSASTFLRGDFSWQTIDLSGYLPLAGGTMTGQLTITQGTANTSVLTSTGYSLTGTNAQSLIDVAGTWNTTGTPTLIKANVTDTASNAASLLMDLQVGGSSRFSVRKDGYATFASGTFINQAGTLSADNIVSSGSKSGLVVEGVRISSGATLAFRSADDIYSGSNDIILARDASDTLAQRSSTNAQTFRIYNTFTDASNYERVAIASATYSSARYFTLSAESAGTGAADLNMVIAPKGNGALIAELPDGTSAGGNARGTNAVDLQTFRANAADVASGSYSGVLSGISNRASSICAVVGGGEANQATSVQCGVFGGLSNTASASYAFVGCGVSNVASGSSGVVAGGSENTVNQSFASILGGYRGLANRYAMQAYAAGYFAVRGDAQQAIFVLRNKTTNNTATTLFLDGSSVRLTIPSGKVLAFTAKISGVKSDGTSVAFFVRKGAIKNVGGTTSLAGTIETIGTDIEDNASTDVAITADDTNDALQINVTGIASETWRWVAVVEGVEIGYGT